VNSPRGLGPDPSPGRDLSDGSWPAHRFLPGGLPTVRTMNETTRTDDPAPPGYRPDPDSPGESPMKSAAPPGRSLRTLAHVLLTVVVAAAAGSVTTLLIQDNPNQSTSALSPEVVPSEVASSASDPVAAVARALAPSVVQIETVGGLGSGVIYDSDGLVLTAAHVVDGSSGPISVRLEDGTRVEGTIVGADDRTDIAVVRIQHDGLRAARLARGVSLRVGQLAVAIGSPFGLEGSVTAGVISAVDRSIATSTGAARTVVQTDAPINPGNSGGALADGSGRVIGINDAIASTAGVNSGVGFAIPIDLAVTAADALVRGEVPPLGYLGISGGEAPSGAAGARVTQVAPGGPADEAGIRAGDLITSFDGQPVADISTLGVLVRRSTPDETVAVQIDRQGRAVTIEVRIGRAE
jgi:S1-C subfamily serine protease